MRQGTVPRGQAPKGRGFGTGFSHTVEFSRNVAGLLFGDSPAVPASCHRRSGGTVPRAFQDRQRLPTCPVSVLLVEHHPPRRHLHTEAPPCAPDLLGVRTATEQPSDRILLAFGDLLSSDADATGVVPERSSVSKNFPACSLEKVAPHSTGCQLGATGWTPAITTVPAVSPFATAGAGPANEGYMLIDAGIPTLCGFGPTGGNPHAPNEWVEIDSLPMTVAMFAGITHDYLNFSKGE